jgi:hypothetical protein
MNFRSNDLLRNFFSVKWHILSKVDSVKWPFPEKKSVIWPFGKMNFRSNGVRSNGFRSNGVSVKWPFGQKNSVKSFSVKWFRTFRRCAAPIYTELPAECWLSSQKRLLFKRGRVQNGSVFWLPNKRFIWFWGHDPGFTRCSIPPEDLISKVVPF